MNSNELIQRYLLGITSDDEVRELERRLQCDEQLQNGFLLQAELDTHLRQEAQSGSLDDDPASGQIDLTPVASRSADPGRVRTRLMQWGSISAAAAVVLASFLLLQNGGGQSAMAAVQRSLNVSAQQKARKYLLEIEFQPASGGTRKIEQELFTDGTDRFALRYPGRMPGSSVWLGQDGPQAWVVPPFGPVLKGDTRIHLRWLRAVNRRGDERGPQKISDMSEMQVTTLLRRMSRGYDLEIIGEDELEIAGRGMVPCQHIRGRHKAAHQTAPDTIELWTSPESGVALQLLVQWELMEGEVGRTSVVLTLQDEEPSLLLPDDWFAAEGHYEGSRTVLYPESSGTD